jgi:hypothetical protein
VGSILVIRKGPALPRLPLSQVRTYFNADEFWQSVEVAHALVFGYGHYTWEWTAALRGYTHPLLFAAPYWMLRVAGLDTPTTLALVPRVLQVRCGFQRRSCCELGGHIFQRGVQ